MARRVDRGLVIERDGSQGNLGGCKRVFDINRVFSFPGTPSVITAFFRGFRRTILRPFVPPRLRRRAILVPRRSPP